MRAWPKKAAREEFEISRFIEAYALLPGFTQLSIVSKGDKPDYVVRDVATHKEFGVELTAVYVDDRSVPDVHMADCYAPELIVDIPFDREKIEKYQCRLISAVKEKIAKSRLGYDLVRPLILAVYVNEYISIYLGRNELEALVSCNTSCFNNMTPFDEVIFWNLGNGGVFQIKSACSAPHTRLLYETAFCNYSHAIDL